MSQSYNQTIDSANSDTIMLGLALPNEEFFFFFFFLGARVLPSHLSCHFRKSYQAAKRKPVLKNYIMRRCLGGVPPLLHKPLNSPIQKHRRVHT